MERWDSPQCPREGSMLWGILMGAVIGFLALWLPLFVPFGDDDGRFWMAVGVCVFVLLGAVTLTMDQADSRQTYIGGVVGVSAGIGLGFFSLLSVLSGVGS